MVFFDCQFDFITIRMSGSFLLPLVLVEVGKKLSSEQVAFELGSNCWVNLNLCRKGINEMARIIRVLIADDHAVVRSGLRIFLMAFDDLKLIGEATNGAEAVKLAKELSPDVILMDLIMPTMDGIRASREIHAKFPEIKIIALTSFTDSTLIHNAIDAGVSGYLFKNASVNELADAIRSVAAGNTTFSPEAARALVTHEAVIEASKDLTSRELEILGLMVAGKSNSDISQDLSIGLSTTKFHVSNILSKMNVKNRSEAIAMAIKNHLVN